MTNLPTLTSTEVGRIAGIASRMQSDHDGEALNAARMTVRALDKHGLRIGEVITNALMPTPAPSMSPQPVYSSRDHRNLAWWCLVSGVVWNERERQFLYDMKDRRNSPTEPQADWLDALHRRAKRAHGAA